MLSSPWLSRPGGSPRSEGRALGSSLMLAPTGAAPLMGGLAGPSPIVGSGCAEYAFTRVGAQQTTVINANIGIVRVKINMAGCPEARNDYCRNIDERFVPNRIASQFSLD